METYFGNLKKIKAQGYYALLILYAVSDNVNGYEI